MTAYDGLMQERDSDPGAMLADKGYASDAIRHDLRDSGATPEIPSRSNRKVQYSINKSLYALRSRIECFIGHLGRHAEFGTPSRFKPAGKHAAIRHPVTLVSGSGSR